MNGELEGCVWRDGHRVAMVLEGKELRPASEKDITQLGND